MPDPTKVFSGGYNPQAPGRICDEGGFWEFVYDPYQVPKKSSRQKLVYRGVFSTRGDSPVAARALVYKRAGLAAFGSECANLRLLTSIGVGPRLLAITQGDLDCGVSIDPVILEQDAGQSLATVLERSHDGCRAAGDVTLAPIGTRDRTLQNAKIMYDIYVQVMNAHRAGVYHRDLRCENVCVRRIGPAPQDIRATVIDFDLCVGSMGAYLAARAPLYQTLFEEIPMVLGSSQLSITPNSLELDMAYLAALQYHVERGELCLNGNMHEECELQSFVAFVSREIGYVGFAEDGRMSYARELDQALDIDVLASLLGLVHVDEATFSSAQLLARARTLCRPYLDGEDMRMCSKSPEVRIASNIDKIALAVFETYKEQCRLQGRTVQYERMEDQPADLRQSNYAQAEHIPVKVQALGYELVPIDECGADLAIDELTPEQIEVVARLEHERFVQERIAAGWTLDRSIQKGDAEHKRSPFLVPYDELEYDIQEYDRDTARQMIPLLRMAGLAMVRQR
jgi:hypothetical protein